MTDLFFILVSVLALAAPAYLFARSGRRTALSRVQARIVAARIGENDTGSLTQYVPLLSVTYVVGREEHVALNLPVARESHADAEPVKMLLAGPYRVGATVDILCNRRRPERASIA